MRRSAVTVALTAIFAPVLLILPVQAHASPRPHPVATTVRTVDLTVGGFSSPRTLAAPTTAGSFSQVGGVWDAGSLAAGAQVQFRAHRAGRWSDWQSLEPGDTAADPGSRDDRSSLARPRQQVASPVWVGRVDAVQGRVQGMGPATAATGATGRIQLVLVDGGVSAADADPTASASATSSAAASEAFPAVLTRAQWGADESLRAVNGADCTRPSYSDTVKVGFVHHTDGPNDYAPSDVPAILRGIYAYHVRTQGWCDIGYNFLVDRFGRAWEGRFGGMDAAVIGAHTGGFNLNSFGTALIGTYSSVAPSAAMRSALDHLLAWKLGQYHRDPTGSTTLISAGGPFTAFPAGTSVPLRTISGHRDADQTSCPGQVAYDSLPGVGTDTRALLGAGLVDPTSSASSVPFGGTGPTISSGVLEPQSWQLLLRRGIDGSVLRTWTGSTAASLSVPVDLHDGAGVPLPPGSYRLELDSNAGSDPATPYVSALEVVPPPQPAGFVPLAPQRVLDTRNGTGTSSGAPQSLGAGGTLTVQITGAGGVPSDGVAAVAVNVTAVRPTSSSYLTVFPAGTVRPVTSVLNPTVGEVRATLVLPRLSPDGRLSVFNAFGTTDVVADVLGYFPTASGASLYHAVTPRRLLDTRSDPSRPRLGANSAVTVPVAGLADVPAGATAALVNVTAVRPGGSGYLTVAPDGTTGPPTSTLNVTVGQIVANRAVTGLNGGALSVKVTTDTDVLVDLVGWFGPATGGGQQYSALTPTRILDTRSGLGAVRGPAGPQSTTRLLVAGRAGVPADATAVVVTLTGVQATEGGYLAAWGDGPRPNTSDLNLPPGGTVPNLAVVPLDAGGGISLFNAAGRTDLLADVLGFYG